MAFQFGSSSGAATPNSFTLNIPTNHKWAEKKESAWQDMEPPKPAPKVKKKSSRPVPGPPEQFPKGIVKHSCLRTAKQIAKNITWRKTAMSYIAFLKDQRLIGAEWKTKALRLRRKRAKVELERGRLFAQIKSLHDLIEAGTNRTTSDHTTIEAFKTRCLDLQRQVQEAESKSKEAESKSERTIAFAAKEEERRTKLLDRRLAELDEKILEMDEKMELQSQMEEQAAAHKDAIEALQQEVAKLRNDNINQEEHIKSLEKENEETRREVKTEKANFANEVEEHQKTRDLTKVIKKEMKELEKTLKHAEETLTECDKEYMDLKKEFADRRNTLDRQRKSIEEKDLELANQQTELVGLSSQLTAANSENDTLKSRIENLEASFVGHENCQETLEEQKKIAQSFQEELEKIKSDAALQFNANHDAFQSTATDREDGSPAPISLRDELALPEDEDGPPVPRPLQTGAGGRAGGDEDDGPADSSDESNSEHGSVAPSVVSSVHDDPIRSLPTRILIEEVPATTSSHNPLACWFSVEKEFALLIYEVFIVRFVLAISSFLYVPAFRPRRLRQLVDNAQEDDELPDDDEQDDIPPETDNTQQADNAPADTAPAATPAPFNPTRLPLAMSMVRPVRKLPPPGDGPFFSAPTLRLHQQQPPMTEEQKAQIAAMFPFPVKDPNDNREQLPDGDLLPNINPLGPQVPPPGYGPPPQRPRVPEVVNNENANQPADDDTNATGPNNGNVDDTNIVNQPGTNDQAPVNKNGNSDNPNNEDIDETEDVNQSGGDNTNSNNLDNVDNGGNDPTPDDELVYIPVSYHNRRSWLKIFLSLLIHLAFYCLLWFAFTTIQERKYWLNANEATRSFLSDILMFKNNCSGSHTFLHRIFSDDIVRTIKLIFLQSLNLFKYELQPYAIPG